MLRLTSQLTLPPDMLQEFSTIKVDPSKAPESAAPAAPKPTPPNPPAPALGGADTQAGADDGFSEDDFAKQLQAGMADLLGELEKSASARPSHRLERAADGGPCLARDAGAV